MAKRKYLHRVLVVLLVSLCSMLGAIASPKKIELEQGELAISYLSSAKVEVDDLCPIGENIHCVVDGSSIRLNFTLMGCSDRLGPISHSIDLREDGSVVIDISAINIHTQESEGQHCLVPKTSNYRIDLISTFIFSDDVVLRFDVE